MKGTNTRLGRPAVIRIKLIDNWPTPMRVNEIDLTPTIPGKLVAMRRSFDRGGRIARANAHDTR